MMKTFQVVLDNWKVTDVITFINLRRSHEFVVLYVESTEPYYPDSNGCEGLDGVNGGDNSEDHDQDFSKEESEGSEENSNDDVDVDADNEETKFKDRDYDEKWDWTGVLPDETHNLT